MYVSTLSATRANASTFFCAHGQPRQTMSTRAYCSEPRTRPRNACLRRPPAYLEMRHQFSLQVVLLVQQLVVLPACQGSLHLLPQPWPLWFCAAVRQRHLRQRPAHRTRLLLEVFLSLRRALLLRPHQR